MGDFQCEAKCWKYSNLNEQREEALRSIGFLHERNVLSAPDEGWPRLEGGKSKIWLGK